MAMEAIAFSDKSKLIPYNKRPLEVPIPPPWNCVRLTFEKESIKVENSHSQTELWSQDEKIDSTAEKFEGVVARASSMLSDFLNNIGDNHLLLFPRIRDEESGLYKFMKAKELPKQDAVISESKHYKTRCYVRVLLHACKEGAFEQGADICAPIAVNDADQKVMTNNFKYLNLY